MAEMVNFPKSDAYEDSGEGGVFVMLVVPESEERDDNCSVDVSITMSQPDVCVSNARTDFWEPYDYRESGLHYYKEIRDVLEAGTPQGPHTRQELNGWLARVQGAGEGSVPVLAALHLGSTCHSLLVRETGECWEAGADDLTPAGRAVYDALRAAYGREPVLLTFLDT